jgi:hypothetical protein
MHSEILKKAKELLENSTIHAIPQLIRTDFQLIRILWIISFLVSSGLCAYFIFDGIKSYLEFEVITKIEFENDIPAIFPSIVICTRNAFSTSYSKEFLQNLSIEKNLDYNRQFRQVRTLGLIRAKSNQTRDDEKKKLGLKFSEFVFKCEFDQVNCREEDLEWFYDYRYGNCFIFNSGKDAYDRPILLKSTYQSGIFGMLTLEVYIDDSFNPFTASHGVHLLINNRTMLINTAEGIDIGMGTETNIGLNKNQYNKIPYPYSECRTPDTLKDPSLYNALLSMNVTYRQKDCINLCYQTHVIKTCECHVIFYNNLNSTRYCSTNVDFNCVDYKVSSSLNESLTTCPEKCPQECEYEKFTYSVTSTSYPSRYRFENSIKTNQFFKGRNITYEEAKQNMLRINIYFDELRTTQVTEIESMTIPSLLSSLGGTLGLLLGFF